MQPPRLATGLVLIPLLAFVLAWQPDLTALQGAPDSATTKKKSATSTSKGVAASAGNSSAQTLNQKASTATAKKSTASRRRSSKAGSKAASRKAPRQQQPEPGRIREIQRALKDH
ncbi:MAG: hypothetical protein ABSC08_17090, partial [Bryobacteraceae bacterium]